MGQPDVEAEGSITRARRWLGRFAAPESIRGKRIALLALLILTGLCLVLNSALGSAAFPVLTLVVPLVFGGLLLAPKPLLVEFIAVLAVVIAENLGVGNNLVHPGAYVVIVVVAGIAFQQSVDRGRL